MGTRSLTIVQDNFFDEVDPDTLLVMYKQYDGYPSGHGAGLKEFLEGIQIVNGMTGSDQKIANGMGCLAAQLLSHFKQDPGGIYVYPSDTRDVGMYQYFIYCGEEKNRGSDSHGKSYREVNIRAQSGSEKLYDGSVADFDPSSIDP